MTVEDLLDGCVRDPDTECWEWVKSRRLSQTQMPAGDRAGVEAHLQRHMDDYKKASASAVQPIYGQEVRPKWQI